VSRAEFQRTGGPETVVFDTLVERLSDVRSGVWKRPAVNSWHRSLLEKIG
jgi:hypothetical protein